MSTHNSLTSPYENSTSSAAPRLASIDTYRGLVMFLMLAEVMHLMTLSKSYPSSTLAEWLAFHTTHVDWIGCSLHDMIQPSFTFLVGVSLPFSLAARNAKGATFASMALHALWRSLLLIVLGVLLRSLGKEQTNFYFVDTLTQIGLGYFFLFLLAQVSWKLQVASLLLILVGYWGLFAAWPLPPPDFDYTTVKVPSDWPHLMSGFAAHWNIGTNPAHEFEVWLMSFFSHEEGYKTANGGYSTLSFIPTLGTMILGMLAGQLLIRKQDGTSKKLTWLLVLGGGMLALGWALGEYGICPVVKRIWTPSWVLVSGGLCFLALGVLHLICDVRGWRIWAWPFLVIGANSITAYVMSWTMEEPIRAFLQRHLGSKVFEFAGEAWQPVILGSSILMVMWLILLWLYRQRIFVRI